MRDPLRVPSMPGASRVQLAPPTPWDESRLLAAAREFAQAAEASGPHANAFRWATGNPIRPGDAMGELIVLSVEPASGATLVADTEVVLVPGTARTDAPLVDLMILLDISESMGLPWDAKHTRLGAARASVESFLENAGASVATVAYAEYAKEVHIIFGPAAPGKLHLVAPPEPKGGSATAKALDAAISHLAKRITPERAQAIMLLTDGVGEVADLLAAAQRAGRLLIPVHSLIFAPEIDEVFADLARSSGGSFQRAGYPLTIEFEHEPRV